MLIIDSKDCENIDKVLKKYKKKFEKSNYCFLEEGNIIWERKPTFMVLGIYHKPEAS